MANEESMSPQLPPSQPPMEDKLDQIARGFDMTKPPSSGFERLIREQIRQRDQRRARRLQRTKAAASAKMERKDSAMPKSATPQASKDAATQTEQHLTVLSPARLLQRLREIGIVPVYILFQHVGPSLSSDIADNGIGEINRAGDTRWRALREAKLHTFHDPIHGIHATSWTGACESVRLEYMRLFGELHRHHRHADTCGMANLTVEFRVRLGQGWREHVVDEGCWYLTLQRINICTPLFRPPGVRMPVATLVARVGCQVGTLRGR